jgi:hypothetical protein
VTNSRKDLLLHGRWEAKLENFNTYCNRMLKTRTLNSMKLLRNFQNIINLFVEAFSVNCSSVNHCRPKELVSVASLSNWNVHNATKLFHLRKPGRSDGITPYVIKESDKLAACWMEFVAAFSLMGLLGVSLWLKILPVALVCRV